MIETKRIILRPLTYEQLKKYTKCDNSLEEELNLNKTSRTISPELFEAFEILFFRTLPTKTGTICIQHSGPQFQKLKIKWSATFVLWENLTQTVK